ncbi:Abi family protein [Agrobacterium sp. DSM 25558]|uniref:Abi family protein n=1 Tax=Agrobacterium sp. DSM 25558 TaxID=1907665 RepID=UPI0013563D59|nr:Abi family protein [Agrobacterium sp. DSM 25558]
MSLIEYQKPYRSPSDLADKLISQGLHLHDRSYAERVIYLNNYFRIKAYFIPFMDSNKQFIAGTTFSDVYDLYTADQNIRVFLFQIVAHLEVRIRAVIDNVVTSVTNDPFWHLNKKNFNKYDEVETAIKKAGSRFNIGKQEFVLHYRERYFTTKSFEHRRIPPFWIISEVFTLEQLLAVAKNIDRDRFRLPGDNKLNACATQFGFAGYDALVTNLQCILELRNICAHHSRLWNKNLRAPSSIAKKMKVKPGRYVKPNRLYTHLVMLRIMCKAQNMDDGICDFFNHLISNHAILAQDMNSMGFPAAWKTDPLWV